MRTEKRKQLSMEIQNLMLEKTNVVLGAVRNEKPSSEDALSPSTVSRIVAGKLKVVVFKHFSTCYMYTLQVFLFRSPISGRTAPLNQILAIAEQATRVILFGSKEVIFTM